MDKIGHKVQIPVTSVIYFVSTRDKFGTSTGTGLNVTLHCEHFSFNKFPIQTHAGAHVKFSTSLDETDFSWRNGSGK
jgi:hypothetical protein